MAYTISFTDAVNKGTISIEDGTINQETSLQLPGRNTTSYGSVIAESFLHLLENFANNTSPSNPVEGQLWFDTTVGAEQLKVYDGTTWTAAGGLKKATTQPEAANSVVGDLWVDTDNQQLYLFTGSGWILVGPAFSDGLVTGATPTTVVGTDNLEYTIILVEVQAQPVAVISKDTFTPKTVISGFSTIKPGINLSNNVFGLTNAKFVGTSEKAESLIVNNTTVPSSNFLRSDVISNTNFPIKIKNNGGLEVGQASQFQFSVEGQAGIVQQNTSGANIDFRVNDGGVIKTVMRIDSTTNVGINNQTPDEALDVTGNIQVSNQLFVDGTTQSSTFGNGAVIVKGGVGIAKNLNIGGDSKVTGTATFSNVIPDTTNNRNLGNELAVWKNVYATNFVGNVIGNVTGTISGRAGSSDKLASSTNFIMSGDVSADTVVFDGQVGGNTKTFNTTISNSFIANKPSRSSAQLDDEVLINRTSGNTGLARLTARALLNQVPINPPGMIVPYAGASVPATSVTGGGVWLLCDGSEVEQTQYPQLFAAIGLTYGTPSDGGIAFFKLPDLRGRMTLGLDNMGGTNADVVTGLRAEELGNTGGTEDITIDVDNLPEHEHDLRAENGFQFYALSTVTKGAESPDESIEYNSPTGTNAGQAIASSGGVLKQFNDDAGTPFTTLGQAIDVMNPFIAINYLIYTGKQQ